MASLALRDRDAIITRDGFIFRVYGYSHLPNGFVCDVEYASSKIFQSKDKRAFRKGKHQVYYKFYADEGLKFVQANYPKYTVFYEPLQMPLVGVPSPYVKHVRKPEHKFRSLMERHPKDKLHRALHEAFNIISERSQLSKECFGVFGSLLHDFYHPSFSDLDFVVYGRKNLQELCNALNEFYSEDKSPVQNEFENERAVESKRWRFVNYGLDEYVWHQQRKMIYALFKNGGHGRVIKMEFEPVKDWLEIQNEYDFRMRIVGKGWIKAVARVTDDCDVPFMPSIYRIEPLKILNETRVDDIQRIVSYVEEFRMQAKQDEQVYVEGNLEQVTTPTKSFHQITLTYCPRYYEQALKVLKT